MLTHPETFIYCACSVDMASSSYAIYDRPKQELTIEIIGKQVHKSNEQNTVIFTDKIQNLCDSKHIGKIHFLIDVENRKIAPIASIHKKLLLNNGESILQSEFKQYTESNNSNFKSKMNWFCFDEFWTMYPQSSHEIPPPPLFSFPPSLAKI